MTADVFLVFTLFCCIYTSSQRWRRLSHQHLFNLPSVHCVPASAAAAISNKPCCPNLQTASPSLCLCAGPSPLQPAAQNTQRATGMFKQRGPTHSDLFTGRGRFKGKSRKGRLQHNDQRRFIYLKLLLAKPAELWITARQNINNGLLCLGAAAN